MKFVSNWKDIAARAHSMWAFYLGLLLWHLPDLIYKSIGIDTNPRLWTLFGTGAIIWGILGRLLDQGIDRSTMRSPWMVALLAVVLALGLVMADQPAAPVAEPVAVVATDTPARPAPDADARAKAFLAEAFPLVAKWEGMRTEAYLDMVGVPTVCFGHTRGVKLSDRYTETECAAMLRDELLEYRARLHRYFTHETKTARLPPKRDAAFGSQAFNVGWAGAGKSTAVRRLNAGDIAGGCEAITWWNKAGGRVVRGLVNRRAEEYALCMDGLG
ncbi:MAG: lysozyme [Pelagimonas sp.]